MPPATAPDRRSHARAAALAVAALVGCATPDAPRDATALDALGADAARDARASDAAVDAGIDAPDAWDAAPDVARDVAVARDAGPPVTRVAAVEQASGRVLVFDTAVANWASAAAVVWSWAPADSPQIAAANRGWFGLLSDVKLKRGGATAIVAASEGGVAIIRVADRAVTFYADQGGNPHAVELLPDGNLVGASSTGSFVRVYSTDPAVSSFPAHVVSAQFTLADAHGVYWDAAHARLLALGGTTLVALRYGGTRQHPTLALAASWPLPSAGGHDLFPVPDAHSVFVTTGSHVYEFDTDRDVFAPSTRFPDRGAIKSIGANPVTGQVAFTTPMTSWWTDTISFAGPAATRVRAGAQFYKARWWFATE